MLLFPLTCLLVTMVSSAPSEGCGRPLDQLTPGLDHRLTVSVSEPGRPDIQRWAIIICNSISPHHGSGTMFFTSPPLMIRVTPRPRLFFWITTAGLRALISRWTSCPGPS